MRLFALIALMMVVLGSQLCFAQGEEASASEEMSQEEMEAMMAEGTVSFFEIPSLSIAESEAFYGGLFGWTFMPMDDTFSMFSGPNNTMGGLSTMGKVAEGGVIPYITVDDIEDHALQMSYIRIAAQLNIGGISDIITRIADSIAW